MRVSTLSKKTNYKACHWCDKSRVCNGKCEEIKSRDAKAKRKTFLKKEELKELRGE